MENQINKPEEILNHSVNQIIPKPSIKSKIIPLSIGVLSLLCVIGIILYKYLFNHVQLQTSKTNLNPTAAPSLVQFNSQEATKSSDLKIFSNQLFTFSYPANWKIEQSKGQQSMVVGQFQTISFSIDMNPPALGSTCGELFKSEKPLVDGIRGHLAIWEGVDCNSGKQSQIFMSLDKDKDHFVFMVFFPTEEEKNAENFIDQIISSFKFIEIPTATSTIPYCYQSGRILTLSGKENNILTSKNGYSTILPNTSKWYLIDDKDNHNECMVRSCPEAETCMEDIVALRFNDKLLDNPNNLSISEWFNKQNIQFYLEGEKIDVTKELISIANKEALKVTDTTGTVAWVYIPINDKVLTLYVSIPTGSKTYRDTHKNDLDQILSTFKFTK